MNPHPLFQEAMDLLPFMTDIRRTLHAHPETGFNLSYTVSYVNQRLNSLGCNPVPCGTAGLSVIIGNPQAEKVFLLRADMDALPIAEETGLSFASANNCMHACGHDMHTAMLLGAAHILKNHEKELEGAVKLMFQPAEELLEGSKEMIKNGILAHPKPDAGMMLHVLPQLPFPTGTAIVCSGGVSAPAADYFTITVSGQSCHGSMPHTGIDPIMAAAHIQLGLQEILTRELAYTDLATLTIGSFHAGNAANVIPDTAVLTGTLRAYDESGRQQLKIRLEEMCQTLASAYRAHATVTFDSGCPVLQNDDTLSKKVLQYARELTGASMAFSTEELSRKSGNGVKSSGSEDFAYISHEIPCVMTALAAQQNTEGISYPLHHPKVRFDEQALPYGAAILAHSALRWLHDHTTSE